MENINDYKDPFGDTQPDYQAFYKALHLCADDYRQHIYDYIGNIPKTSFSVEMVDKLKEMGYKLTKI
jgi:hypothetical protein